MKINVFKMQILMGERGLTIKKLAELSGVSRQTISCIISGRVVHRRWHIKLLQL